MAASEKDISSRVVCSIDLTQDNLTPTVDLTQGSTYTEHVAEPASTDGDDKRNDKNEVGVVTTGG